MSGDYWVVTVIQRFDAIELASPIAIPAAIKTEDEPHCYLPVFSSLEAAIAWNLGSSENIYQMRGVERPEDSSQESRHS